MPISAWLSPRGRGLGRRDLGLHPSQPSPSALPSLLRAPSVGIRDFSLTCPSILKTPTSSVGPWRFLCTRRSLYDRGVWVRGRGQRWVGNGGSFAHAGAWKLDWWLVKSRLSEKPARMPVYYTQLPSYPHLRPSPLSPSRKSTVSTMCSSILGPATCRGEGTGRREGLLGRPS